MRAVFALFLSRAVLLAWLAAASLYGQATGRIEGVIVDPQDSAVAGVQVVGLNVGTGLRHEVLSSAKGILRFPELPIGSYQVTVSKTGFQRLVREQIDLRSPHVPVGLKILF